MGLVLQNFAYVRVSSESNNVMGLTYECDSGAKFRESKDYIAVIGEAYGSLIYKDGKKIQTSAIKRYKLGEKNPDYIKFERAVAEDFPILENWSIGKLSDGIYIKGNIRGESKIFMKKIIAQDGAILTFYDNTKVFVDWVGINPTQKIRIEHFGLNPRVVRGRPFCGIAYEPDIFNSDWSKVAAAVELSDDIARQMRVSYTEFERAVANGVPILENWSIGNLSDGIYIKGNIRGESKNFMKKVIAQDGAILTFYDNTKAFVDWVAINPTQKIHIERFGMKCGIAYEPEIFNSEWSKIAAAVELNDDIARLMGVI